MNKLSLTCLLNVFGLALCVSFGIFTLYIHNSILPYVYFIFAVCVIIAHSYLYCTRCVYYGKDCYIFGGRFSKVFFKARRPGSVDPDDAITASLWFLLAMFPVPFLLYYMDLILAAVYVGLFCAWFYIHNNTACRICGNEWCGLCRKHKK